jgi:hypothetical protein
MTQPSREELLACPFCGGKPENGRDNIRCDGCGNHFAMSVAAWNARTGSAQTALNERVWCKACGTVTSNGTCDCNCYPEGHEMRREPNFINYADTMAEQAAELIDENHRLREALSAALPASSGEVRPYQIEMAAQAMYEFEPWEDGTTWRTMPEAGKNAFRENMRFVFEALKSSPSVAVQPVEEWKPIETAPRNRMLLTGFFNSAGKWRSMHAQYRDDLPQHDDAEDDDEPAEAGWYEGSLEAEMLTRVSPTHWQPLPAPPSTLSSTNQPSEGGE